MRIGFHTNSLSFRGTEIAVFDYAFHNQALLHNQSLIFYKATAKSEPAVIQKFAQHFKLFPYRDIKELANLADREKIDLLYMIKSGARDGDLIDNVPCAVHAVFPTKAEEFHGDKLAFVSEWLAKEYSNGKIPFVPHMIDLPSVEGDLRSELSIPKEATVLACYGGNDSFNLKFVHETILKVLEQRQDLYFLFMNIDAFAKHDRLLFLPGTSAIDYKLRFINTADGMIHARGIGESFGLACGEFSIKNKPVITYALSPQRSHIEILGDKAILYKGRKELEGILFTFDRKVQLSQQWNAYSEFFAPTAVMKKFQEVFLSDQKTTLELSMKDRLAIQGYRLIRKLRNLTKKYYL